MGPRLGSLLAAILALPVGAAELPKTDGWVEVRTSHFTLYGSAGTRDTKKVGIELERFREALGRITKGFELPAEIPTAVYVFRNDAQFTPYKLDPAGRAQNISGYFAERPFRNYVTIDASAMTGMHVAYHEYVHAVLNRTLPRVPSWLNEGLAEFYGTFRFNALSNDAEVGSAIEGRVQVLAEHGMMPIAELFSTHATHTAGEQSQQVFYAQSWLLVHYLITDEARRARLSRLLSMLRDGRDPDDAVAEALEVEPVALLEQLQRYFETGGGRFKIRFDDPIEKQTVEARDLAAGEVLLRLGVLLAELGDWNADAARVHLEAALAQGGPRASIQAALGSVAEKRDDFEEASRRYRLATETEGADAEVYARRGSFMLRRFLEQNPTFNHDADTVPQPLLEARALLAKSVELYPHGVDALAALGLTYVIDGAGIPNDGILALQRASALRPDRLEVLVDLADLLGRAGRTGEAWSVVKTRLAPRATEPRFVEEAERRIVRSEWNRANALVSDRDVEAATALLAGLEREITDAELRNEVTEYREQLAQRAPVSEVAAPPETGSGTPASPSTFVVIGSDEAERVQRVTEAINHAVELMNAGDEDGAIALIDSTLAACPKSEFCDHMRVRADELRAVVAQNRTIEGVNEAIRLINEGKRKQGIERLRELESECKDSELAARIRSLLDELGAR